MTKPILLKRHRENTSRKLAFRIRRQERKQQNFNRKAHPNVPPSYGPIYNTFNIQPRLVCGAPGRCTSHALQAWTTASA